MLVIEERPCHLLATWRETGLYTDAGSLSDSVHGNLAQLMDQLVNDYLAANP